MGYSTAHNDLTTAAGESFWAKRKAEPWWSWWHLLELAAAFAIGATVMNFLYAETAAAGGVPGHDAWYHVKMAELLPQIGATKQFPWLRFVYFTESGDQFVSHHWGFHLLLVPFVNAAKWLGGDALTGGRWAISTFFAGSLTLFQLILMSQRVRCRWLWLGLYLLMPSQFFSRHAFVRAIAPSLLLMFVIVVLMFRRRYLWAGLAVAAYTHLYLGGVVFAPLLVGCYVAAGLVGPRGERVSWRLAAFTLGGWVLGVVTYPYAGGTFEFLRLQIFGSGLTADISVGQEWQPYTDVWWLARESVWVLIPLAVSACLRLRFGPRITAEELSVLLMSFAFAWLMLKSRRFVEYWPPFGLLATALLARPLLDAAIAGVADRLRGSRPAWRYWLAAALWVASGGVIAAVILRGGDLHIDAVRDHWRLWMVLATAYLLAPLGSYWQASAHCGTGIGRGGIDVGGCGIDASGCGMDAGGRGIGAGGGGINVGVCGLDASGCGTGILPAQSAPPGPPETGQARGSRTVRVGCWAAAVLAVPLAGAAFAIALVGVLRLALGTPDVNGVRLAVPSWCYAALAVAYLLASWRAVRRRPAVVGKRMIAGPVGLATIVAGGLAFVSWLLATAGPQMVSLQRKLKPEFDLAEIRAAMDTLVAASEPGSVVFTDDWDIFPVYFYVNTYNNYIVGLDPKFTQHRRPVLWERYKIISRGQTPKWYDVPPEHRADVEDGAAKVRVRLEDIRDYFGAQYVIVDRDHKPFRQKLDAAREFCERIYPPPAAEEDTEASAEAKHGREDPAYAVYRVFSEEEQASAEAAAREARRQRRLPADEADRAGPVRRPTSKPVQSSTSAPVDE